MLIYDISFITASQHFSPTLQPAVLQPSNRQQFWEEFHKGHHFEIGPHYLPPWRMKQSMLCYYSASARTHLLDVIRLMFCKRTIQLCGAQACVSRFNNLFILFKDAHHPEYFPAREGVHCLEWVSAPLGNIDGSICNSCPMSACSVVYSLQT